MANLNWVDNVILVIFILSILAGLMRGFIREVIAVLTWIAAFFVTIYFWKPLAMVFSGSEHALSTASISASIGILFIGTMIVGAIINYIIARIVEGQGISFTNRLLGGIFGLARAFLIVVVGIFLLQLTEVAAKPYWTSSQFVHSLQPAVKWVNDLVEPQMKDMKSKISDKLKEVMPAPSESVTSPVVAPAAPAEKK